MFKLTVNVEFNECSDTQKTYVLGVFKTMDEAIKVAHNAIVAECNAPLTDTETKYHVRNIMTSAGAVFRYKSKDSSDFAEIRYYWVEKINCVSADADVAAAITLIESGVNIELENLLQQFIMEKLSK